VKVSSIVGKQMPLTLLHKIAATILACVLFIIVLRLVRRKRLDTALSVWWIATSLAIIALAWSDRPLRLLALRMTLEVSSVILVSGILFLLFTCLHMSASITKLSQQIRQIGQVMALNNIQKPVNCRTNEEADQKPEQNPKSDCATQNSQGRQQNH
jgi:hypothetical protein